MGFSNLTPFEAHQYFLSDRGGRDVLTFVVKATYEILEGGATAISESQAPIHGAAAYYGEPGKSSIRYDSEICYAKDGTDCILIGHAQTPGRAVPQLDVIFKVADLLKSVRVSGDRHWKHRPGSWKATPAIPFTSMPLVYELAYGGWDTSHTDRACHGYCGHNPVGTGYIADKSAKKIEGIKLPNLEDPRVPMESPKSGTIPAGFGYIAPDWHPRRQYAGTYDDAWMNEKMPLLPDDFDIRFFNAASGGLTSPEFLKGGEQVEVINASARGTLRFSLPRVHPRATLKLKNGGLQRRDLNLDTVIVNADEDRLYLIWRAGFDVHNQIYDMVWAKTQL